MIQSSKTIRDSQIRLGLACNQNCGHCHLHTTRVDAPSAPPLAQLDAMLARGLRSLVVTGGEPTLSPHLLPTLRWARENDIDVTLETNAIALASLQNRERLHREKLRRIRVHLPAIERQRYAAVTRDDQFDMALVALRGLLHDGFTVELAMPVLAINLDDVAGVADFVAAELPGVKVIHLITFRAEEQGISVHLHPSPEQWQRAAQTALLRAQTLGLSLQFARGQGMPACLLENPQQVPQLVARGQANLAQDQPSCALCALRDDCPRPPQGLLQAHPQISLRPVESRALQRALGALHAKSLPLEHYVRDIVEKHPDGQMQVREILMRIVQQCNERCTFCWIDFEATACPLDLIDATLARIKTLTPRPILSLTGGEPTLHPDLLRIVERAHALDLPKIILQTNATLCAQQDRAGKLAAAGLTDALVGFHGHNAQLYERVTELPHSFQRAVAGVRALLSAGVAVTLNHVLNRDNAEFVSEFVIFVRDELVGTQGQRPLLTFAAAAEIAGGPLKPEVLVKISDLAAPLVKALDICIDNKIEFAGLAHPCGFPPCILGGDPRYFHDILRWRVDDAFSVLNGTPAGVSSGEPGVQAPEMPGKIPACATCVYDRFCTGLRGEYVAKHGTAELRPVTQWPAELQLLPAV